MKRLLLALLPWMVTAIASAQDMPRPAQVFFTHFGKLSAPSYQIGTECFVTLDAVQTWGWKAKVVDTEVEVTAESKKFKVPYRQQSGNTIIPLSPILHKLDAECGWIEGTGQFMVLAPIKSIKFVDGKLKVDSALKIKPRISYLQEPDRIVIDFVGAKLSPNTNTDLPKDVRVGQYKPDIVRFAFNTEDKPVNPNLEIDPTSSYAVDLSNAKRNALSNNEDLNTPITIIPVTQNPPTTGTTQGNSPPTQTQTGPPTLTDINTAPATPIVPTVVAGPVRLLADKKTSVTLAVSVSAKLPKPPMFKRVDPETLEIYLPGAKHSAEEAPKLDTEALAGIEIEQTVDTAIIRLKLEKPMGIELTNTGLEIQIALIRPTAGDGKLAGKVIVVDPGHGAHDSGAKSPGKEITEKEINLRVGKELARQLTAQGATVILTRKTDVFIELKERPAIANRNGADLFISIHTNSNKKANSTSGTITFYHNSDPLGTLLADCIQTEIGKVSGIPSIGTWSDTKIYDSGFAVLRYSQMPCVLIELGFINHSKDRARLKSDDFPIIVSRAIVKGIKVYLGDEKEN